MQRCFASESSKASRLVAKFRFEIRCRAGYTLLELSIVMMIVIGMLAMIWPALSKPLATNELQEAASNLRTHLAEARTLAMRSGEPVLVRISHGSGSVDYGVWSNVQLNLPTMIDQPLANGMTSALATDGATSIATTPSDTIETWTLPTFVKVRRVSHDKQRDPATESDSPLGLADDAFGDDLWGDTDDARESQVGLPETDDPLDDATDDLQVSWVWFLPQGQASEATIQLEDPRTNRSLDLHLTSWNGRMEISKPRTAVSELTQASSDWESSDGLLDDRTSARNLDEASTDGSPQ